MRSSKSGQAKSFAMTWSRVCSSERFPAHRCAGNLSLEQTRDHVIANDLACPLFDDRIHLVHPLSAKRHCQVAVIVNEIGSSDDVDQRLPVVVAYAADGDPAVRAAIRAVWRDGHARMA